MKLVSAKSMSGMAASAALVLTSFVGLAAPASAQWGYDPYYYRRDRGISIGDVLTGVILVGTVVTIANQIGKKERRNDDRYERRDRERTRGDDRYEDRRGEAPRYQPNDGRYQAGTGTGDRSMNDAVDRCLDRARSPEARVDSVLRRGSGWEVAGTMDAVTNGVRFVCEVAGDGAVVRFQNQT